MMESSFRAMKAFEQKLRNLGGEYHPTTCHWELTRRCNAACDYCYARVPSPEDLPTDTLFQIAEKIVSEGILYVVVSGGEPFIRKDILQVLGFLFNSDLFWVSILTNGTLIGDKELDFLSANAGRINMLQMSVFSHRPEVNDSYFKVNGALEKTLNVAKVLTNAGVNVVFAHNIFNFNAEEARNTKEFFSDQGLNLQPAFAKHVNSSNEWCLQSERSCSDYLDGYLEAIHEDQLKSYIQKMKDGMPDGFPDRFVCNAARSFVSIDYQGLLWPCTAFRDMAIGSVLSGRSFHQMLKDSDIGRNIHRIRNKDFEKCTKCDFYGFCSQCIGANYTETGSFTIPSSSTCRFAETVSKLAFPK